jgi:hypothetical protein
MQLGSSASETLAKRTASIICSSRPAGRVLDGEEEEEGGRRGSGSGGGGGAVGERPHRPPPRDPVAGALPLALPVQLRVQGLARALLRPRAPSGKGLPRRSPASSATKAAATAAARASTSSTCPGGGGRWSTPRSVSCAATKRSLAPLHCCGGILICYCRRVDMKEAEYIVCNPKTGSSGRL